MYIKILYCPKYNMFVYLRTILRQPFCYIWKSCYCQTVQALPVFPCTVTWSCKIRCHVWPADFTWHGHVTDDVEHVASLGVVVIPSLDCVTVRDFLHHPGVWKRDSKFLIDRRIKFVWWVVVRFMFSWCLCNTRHVRARTPLSVDVSIFLHWSTTRFTV